MNTPRRFSLMNGNGEELDLLTHSLFLNEPGGLGYTRDDEYRRIGDRWVLVSAHLSQEPVTGKLSFLNNNPYEQYFQFIKFTQVAPLVLIYRPDADSTNVFRRLVRISKLEKGEVNNSGYLECRIEFLPLAPWYRPVTCYNVNTSWMFGDNSDSLGWTLDIYQDSILWASSVPYYCRIDSDTYLSSPCRLTIYGPMTNPSWRHYVGGTNESNLVADGIINITLQSGEYVVIDNTEDPYSIIKYSGPNDTVGTNVYQDSRFDTLRFINIQHGTNYIRFAGDNYQSGNLITAEAFLYYESV